MMGHTLQDDVEQARDEQVAKGNDATEYGGDDDDVKRIHPWTKI
jgi:hypothetical protein